MILEIDEAYAKVLRLLALSVDDRQLESHSFQEFFRPLLEGNAQKLLSLCDKNIVTLRLAEALQQLGLTLPEAFLQALAQERARIHKTKNIILRMSSMLSAAGIDFVLTKAFQHDPDMGHDIDLLLAEKSHRADELIIKEFGAVPERQTRINSVAGKIGYDIPGASPVEIHHGLMGHFGEHAWYPAEVISRAVLHPVDGGQTRQPAADDRIVIHVLQRLYSHGYFRISDVLSAFILIREGRDWLAIEKTCEQLGASYAFKCFLTYVHQLHATVMGFELLSKPLHDRFFIKGLAPLRPKKSVLFIPKESVMAAVYLARLGFDLTHLNWRSLGKTCLIPFLAVDFVSQRLWRKWRSGSRRAA